MKQLSIIKEYKGLNENQLKDVSSCTLIEYNKSGGEKHRYILPMVLSQIAAGLF